MKRVVVAMSGGVDSSVSALLLKEAGFEVIGLFMKNWEEPGGKCTAQADYEDVARVASVLQIPHYSVRFVEEYRERVFQFFLRDLEAGRTPNPDILCNREIKFHLLWEKACSLGADFLATGHYCRIQEGRLYKGRDPLKDQSYFLHAISGALLSKVLFPVGDLPKSRVREIAKKAALPVAEKKDSTGICFIGERDFQEFLMPYLGKRRGELRRLSGEVVGYHEGAVYYTIGQRRGLKLGGEGEPWYVIGKEIEKNIVYVERGKNHPALFSSSLVASGATWLHAPPRSNVRCSAKIRYRQADQPCLLTLQEEGRVVVQFDEPQRAITPGQAVVFYAGEECLGGATID
ncbi:MAG: tRNA 2-thiouridine(34) synthase MnmA [Verrucomicrobiota bacterium]|nr:tRNA 2-thiouridine(34) synthase MnmA [Verrucomicrobiota bacterium]